MKKLLKILRLILMAPAIFLFATGGDGGGSNAGSDDGGNTGGTGGTGGTGDQGGQGGTGGAGGQGGQGGGSGSASGGRTYSEEEANRIAQERAERAGNAALKSYFEQQGFSREEVDQLLKEHKAKKLNSKKKRNGLTEKRPRKRKRFPLLTPE